MCMTSLLVAGAELKRLTPAEFEGAKQPQITIGEKGKVFVVFGKENGIYICQRDEGAGEFSPPTQIAEVPKLALGMRRGPRVAVVGEVLTVTAISHAEGNLYSWVSKGEGKAWSKATAVNTVTNSAREGLHALAGDGKSK